MIDGPYKNIIPEKIKPLEANEDLESVVNDIKNLKSEIEKDVAEIGGEEELENELSTDSLLKEKYQIRKEKIAWCGAMIATAIYSGVFGKYALSSFDIENVQSSLESLKGVESIMSITFAVMTLISYLGLRQTNKKENKGLNKTIDQV